MQAYAKIGKIAFSVLAALAWPAFADPPSPPPTLIVPVVEVGPSPRDEFTAALVSVYASHPQLKAEREAIKATDETVNQAISGFRPDVTTEYDRGRQRGSLGDSGWKYHNTTEKTLSVTQPIFSGGSTVAGYLAARDRVKAGRAQLTALEQQVLLAAVVAYTDVVAKQSVLEVNQNNVDVLTRQLQATQAGFDVGTLTKTDLAQSQSRLATAEAAERQALGNLESSRATFRRIVGYDPPQVLPLPPTPDTLPQNAEEAKLAAENAEPTLEAARHLEKAAESDVDANAGSLLPNVSLRGTMDRSSGTSLFSTGALSNDALTLNLVIPLYQSGAEWSRLRQAKDTAQQAKFNTLDTRNGAVETASRAWQDYDTAKAVIASSREAVKAAEVALDSIRQENQYGTRTILDVLNTEQDMFNAQLALVNARINEKQQAYRLLAAVGRLTAKDLKLPVDLDDPTKHYDDVKYKLLGF